MFAAKLTHSNVCTKFEIQKNSATISQTNKQNIEKIMPRTLRPKNRSGISEANILRGMINE